MGVPGNIGSSVLTPGTAISVNLLAGDQAIGGGGFKALLLAPKGSAGAATADTTVTRAAGPDAAATALGSGTPGHLFAKAAFKEFPLLQLDVVAVTAPSGVAASGTITFDDSSGTSTDVTVQQGVTTKIHGRTITTQWAPGVGKVAIATQHTADINALSADLAVSAANGSGSLAVVTVTAKIKGTWGNDIALSSALSGGTGGSVTASGAHLASGSTEMDIATALTTVAGTEYDIASIATGNTDVASSSSTSNPNKARTAFVALASGFAAKLQQIVLAHTGTLSAVKTGVASMNSGIMEVVHARGMLSLPCELAGAELGARMREESVDVDVNRTNRGDMPYLATLYPSASLTSDDLTAAELEDALQSGVSPVAYTSTNAPYIKMPRTTYFKDFAGNPDRRLVFVSQTTTDFAVAKDVRSFLPARFPGKKIVPLIPPGDDEVPPNVVDVPTILSAVRGRLYAWVRRGAIRKDKLDQAVRDGTFAGNVDSGNSSKVNLQLPIAPVPPLTTFDVQVLGS